MKSKERKNLFLLVDKKSLMPNDDVKHISNNGAFASIFSNPLLITVQLQIEEISRKLRTGDLGISQNLEERFDTHSATTLLLT